MHSLEAFASWRREEQLVGLQDRHPVYNYQVVTTLEAATGVVVSRVAALHDSDDMMVIGSNFAGATPALIDLVGMDMAERGFSVKRYQSFVPKLKTAVPIVSLDYAEDMLLIGSSEGNVFIAQVDPNTAPSKGKDHSYAPIQDFFQSNPKGKQSSHWNGAFSFTPSKKVLAVQSCRKDLDLFAGCEGHCAHIWNIAGETTCSSTSFNKKEPVSLAPMTALEWCPMSTSCVMCGNADGLLAVYDSRSRQHSPMLSMKVSDGAMSSVAFNRQLGSWCAYSDLEGFFGVVDVRFPSAPLLRVPTLQGSTAACRWMPFQSDLLITVGNDDAMKVWNLRMDPTYCVGKCTVGSSGIAGQLSQVFVTESMQQQRALTVTLGGEICSVQVTNEALHVQAPHHVTSGVGGDAPQEANLALLDRQVEQYLYSRQFASAYATIVEALALHAEEKGKGRAGELLSCMDTFTDAETMFSLQKEHVRQEQNPEQVLQGLLQLTTSRLPKGFIDFSSREFIRDAQPIDDKHKHELDSQRLNVSIAEVLNSGQAEGVSTLSGRVCELVRAGSASLHLGLLKDALDLALISNYTEGARIVEQLVEACNTSSGPVQKKVLAILAEAVLAPFVLSTQGFEGSKGELTHKANDMMTSFLENTALVSKTILFVAKAQSLSENKPLDAKDSSIAYQTLQQALKIEKEFPKSLSEMVSLKAIAIYLQSLLGTTNYVGYFWFGVQLIERYKEFPNVQHIRRQLSLEVDKLCRRLRDLSDEAIVLAEAVAQNFTARMFRDAARFLDMFHPFVSVLYRMIVECENVVQETGCQAPQAMVDILDTLNDAISEALENWSELLATVAESDEGVRNILLTTRQFYVNMSLIVQEVPSAAEDETLDSVLEQCEEVISYVQDVSTIPIERPTQKETAAPRRF